MGIRHNPPHTVTVQTKVKKQGIHGIEMVPGESFTVPCFVQPVSTEEMSTLGVQVSTAYRVFAQSWPGGPYTTVIFDGPQGESPGRRFSQHGEARSYGRSPRTAHFDVLIVAKDAEAK